MIHSDSVRSATIPFGPGQQALKVSTDADTLTLEIGWPDPWRPTRRLSFTKDVAMDLSNVLAELSR